MELHLPNFSPFPAQPLCDPEPRRSCPEPGTFPTLLTTHQQHILKTYTPIGPKPHETTPDRLNLRLRNHPVDDGTVSTRLAAGKQIRRWQDTRDSAHTAVARPRLVLVLGPALRNGALLLPSSTTTTSKTATAMTTTTTVATAKTTAEDTRTRTTEEARHRRIRATRNRTTTAAAQDPMAQEEEDVRRRKWEEEAR